MSSNAGMAGEQSLANFTMFPEPPLSVLSARGPDTLDFLHRLSASDVKGRGVGSASQALFLKGDGRLVADSTVLLVSLDQALIVTATEFAQPLHELLDRFLFTEKVELRVEKQIRVVEFAGQVPSTFWRKLGLPDVKVGTAVIGIPGNGFAAGFVEFANGTRRAFLLGDQDQLPQVFSPLQVAAEAAGGIVGNNQQREEKRICEGIPAAGHELTEATIPLEAGLRNAVSFTKGCFPGQEVMARIDTLGHPAKMLVKLEFEEVPSSLRGAAIEADGVRIGQLTSHVVLAPTSRSVGLGYVKWAHHETTDPLILNHPDFGQVTALLVHDSPAGCQ